MSIYHQRLSVQIHGHVLRLTISYSIKCIICNKNLIQARYSQNQLKKYKERIHFDGVPQAERPNCQNCTGSPSFELRCVDCGFAKSLDQFSRNARRKDRDNAVGVARIALINHANFSQHCWDCQQKVSDQEPIVEDAIREEEILDEYKTKGSPVCR